MTASNREFLRDGESWDDGLRAEFQRLAKQPVGRGPEAGELWARAEVARRLQDRSDPAPETASSSLVLGPLVGAVVALALVLAVGFGASWSAEGSGTLTVGLSLVLGSLGVLGLAACSSLALLWNDL